MPADLRLVEPEAASEAASDRLRRLLKQQDEVVLAGVAGSGKTTLVRELAGDRGVVLCAPTAKAAGRLKEVTGRPATTVHSLIYGAPTEQWVRPDGEVCKGFEDEHGVKHPPPGCPGCACRSRLVFSRGDGLDDVRVIVVDEASMIGRQVASDIRASVARLAEEAGSETPRILWVGDPAQLPPVGDEPGADLDQPDVLLTTVYRARGGILELATRIREAASYVDIGRALDASYADVVVDPGELQSLADWRAGRSRRMAITHTNRQRVEANGAVRAALRRVGPLVRGDRIIVRKNLRQVPVWNGEVYVVEQADWVDPFTVVRAHLDGLDQAPRIRFVVHEKYLATADQAEFGRDVRELDRQFRDLARIEHAADCTFFDPDDGDDCRPECQPGPLHSLHLVNAQHGFAITCHAAQGSEAEEVGVLWSPYTHGDRFAEARAWLYTAVTRARRQLTVFTRGGR